MTPEQIAGRVDRARDLVGRSSFDADPMDVAFVSLADLVERHLEAIRAFNEQQKKGQEPDAETLERLDATEIALSRAVRR